MLIIERKDGSIYVRANSVLGNRVNQETRFLHGYRFNIGSSTKTDVIPNESQLQIQIVETGKATQKDIYPEVDEELLLVSLPRMTF